MNTLKGYITYTLTILGSFFVYDIWAIYKIFNIDIYPAHTSFEAVFERREDILFYIQKVFFNSDSFAIAILILAVFCIHFVYSFKIAFNRNNSSRKRKLISLLSAQLILVLILVFSGLLTSGIVFGISNSVAKKKVGVFFARHQAEPLSISNVDLKTPKILTTGTSFNMVRIPSGKLKGNFYETHIYPFILIEHLHKNYGELKKPGVFLVGNLIIADSDKTLLDLLIPKFIEEYIKSINNEYILNRPQPKFVFLSGDEFIKKFKKYAYKYQRVPRENLDEIDMVPNGFVDPIDSTLYIKVRPGYNFPHYLALAQHEALHYYSRGTTQQEYLPYYIEEGLTEYIRQKYHLQLYGNDNTVIKYIGW